MLPVNLSVFSLQVGSSVGSVPAFCTWISMAHTFIKAQQETMANSALKVFEK
jgi:hypothetical protein